MNLLAWSSVAVLVGLALAPEVQPTPLVCAGALLVLLPLARLRRGFLVPVGFLLGLCIAASVPLGPVLRGPVSIQGRVAAAPVGRVADVAVWACAPAGQGFEPCVGRVRVIFPTPPAPASEWVIFGEAGVPRAAGPPGGPSRVRSAALARVRTVLRARRVVPLGATTPERPVLEGPAAVLAAVASGDRRGVDEQTWAVLRDTGTSHLLAISGFHVGVVAGAVGGGMLLGIRRLGALRPEGVSTVWAWWAGAAAAGVYAWSAGAPISAQRAAGVVLLAAIGRSMGRQLDAMRMLAVAAVAVCVVDPGAIATPGFQLSFGAVLGLLRFSSLFDGIEPPRGLGWAKSGLVATAAATLGTLPAAAWWFQSLSITSPLANLFAVPFMAVAVVPCAALAEWGPAPLDGLGGWLGGWAVRFMLAGLDLLRTAPLAPAVGPLGALILCGVFLRIRVGWIASVLILGLGLRTRSAGGMEVLFFDVGQGDSALVEYPDGRRWLVDGGRNDAVRNALRRMGVRSLDVVVASHGDADHAAGLLPVLESLRVRELWIGRVEGHEALLSMAVARGVKVRRFPSRVESEASANDASLVVRARSRWGEVLFAGDVEEAGEAWIREPATVLKVPHHGSATSSSPGLLDRVQPELAVLSVGFNRYGHPHDAVLERYRERSIPVLRTDLDASIRLRFDEQGVRAYSASGPLIWLAGDRRAYTPKKAMAPRAMTMLNPWL